MKKIDVCLSPELLHLYDLQQRVVVVVDILRATSCITAGIACGIKSIIPVASLDECKKLQRQGMVAGAERDGKKAEGFDLGNSPFDYMDDRLRGKTVAMTTTNGTQAIEGAKNAYQIVIGSFLNLSTLVNFLSTQERDLLVLCAGWKGKFNLEDTLFAGALVENLLEHFESEDDAALAAGKLYLLAKSDLLTFISNSSHVNRLKRLNIEKDLEFCLKPDQFEVIPILQNGQLIKLDIVNQLR